MIRTYCGLWVDPLNLDPKQVSIRDIAVSLSRLCRFNGHISRFYSVAEHCLLGSEIPDQPGMKLAFLLHDAAEAYIGDIVGPLKRRNMLIDGHRIEDIEASLLDRICDGLHLEPKIRELIDSDTVGMLDARMVKAEQATLTVASVANPLPQLEFDTHAHDTDELAFQFMLRFKELAEEWTVMA